MILTHTPTQQPAAMKTFEFTAVLLPVGDFDAAAERLAEAGCTDGLFAESNGVQTIEFDRDAETLREAILSAIRDIHTAGLKVARIATAETQTVNEINETLPA